MPSLPFDASQAVTFDLERGQVRRGESEPGLFVPVPSLLALCEAAGPDATSALARSLGESIGQNVKKRLSQAGGDARAATSEAFVEHLAGELAVAGLGSLSIERWGRALVLVLDHAPLGAHGDKLVAGILATAVSAVTSTDARTVQLVREGARARFLVAGQAGIYKVEAWLGDGVSWGEALVRLHEPSTAGGAA
jgi:hypothetical protein